MSSVPCILVAEPSEMIVREGSGGDLCKCLAEGNKGQESLAGWPLAQERPRSTFCSAQLLPTAANLF